MDVWGWSFAVWLQFGSRPPSRFGSFDEDGLAPPTMSGRGLSGTSSVADGVVVDDRVGARSRIAASIGVNGGTSQLAQPAPPQRSATDSATAMLEGAQVTPATARALASQTRLTPRARAALRRSQRRHGTAEDVTSVLDAVRKRRRSFLRREVSTGRCVRVLWGLHCDVAQYASARPRGVVLTAPSCAPLAAFPWIKCMRTHKGEDLRLPLLRHAHRVGLTAYHRSTPRARTLCLATVTAPVTATATVAALRRWVLPACRGRPVLSTAPGYRWAASRHLDGRSGARHPRTKRTSQLRLWTLEVQPRQERRQRLRLNRTRLWMGDVAKRRCRDFARWARHYVCVCMQHVVGFSTARCGDS